MALMGFGDFDDMFGRVDRMMNNVMRGMLGSMPDPYEMLNDMNAMSMRPHHYGRSYTPSVQSFSMTSSPLNSYSHYSSSVMHMSSDVYGRPQVYEATQSSRYAPGGVQETRSTVRDSRTGLHQMSIGHHIEDRAHIMQRSRNYYTGTEEHNDEYVNIDDTEAPEFNREWQRRASGALGRGSSRAPDILAIGGPSPSEPTPLLALPPCEPSASTSHRVSPTPRASSHARESHRVSKSKKSKSRKDKRPYKKP